MPKNGPDSFITRRKLDMFSVLCMSKWWVPHLITVLVSLVILGLTSSAPVVTSGVLFYLPAVFWQGVAGSAFAAVIVTLFQRPTIFLDLAERKEQNDALSDLREKGIIGAITQRGSAEATKFYAECLESARFRIWALGMTNQKLVEDHLSKIIELTKSHSSLDVVIGFWNPEAKIILPGQSDPVPLADLQTRLEKKIITSNGTTKEIRSRQDQICKSVSVHGTHIKGRIRLVDFSLPTNFTAFVIDEFVFFFPFLVNSYSTATPTIIARSDCPVGEAVVAHFETLLGGQPVAKAVTKIVFDSSSPA